MAETETKHKANRKLLMILVIIVVLCAVCYAAQAAFRMAADAPTTTRRESSPSTYTVVYIVTGTPPRAGLTYNNKGGNTEQADVALTWRYEFEARPGHFLYVSAQTEGDTASARIGCKIEVEGIVVEEANSSGPYKIATCSGKL